MRNMYSQDEDRIIIEELEKAKREGRTKASAIQILITRLSRTESSLTGHIVDIVKRRGTARRETTSTIGANIVQMNVVKDVLKRMTPEQRVEIALLAMEER